MKYTVALQIAAIVAISVLLSFFVSTTKQYGSTSPCYYLAGCENTRKLTGKLTITSHGFPLAHSQSSKFEVTSPNPPYAETSTEKGSPSVIAIGVSTLFWYALLHSLLVAALSRKKAQ